MYSSSHALLRGLFSGIWLGLLRHETLLKINRSYYSCTKKYKDFSYNKSGLWAWERAIIARYFRNCKRLLLIGAGGGRGFSTPAAWLLGPWFRVQF